MTRFEVRRGTRLAGWVNKPGLLVRSRWRELIVLPLIAALVISLFADLRLFRLTNGLMFDLAVSGTPAGEPQAVVVRAPLEEIPVVAARLRALGAQPVTANGDRSAGLVRISRPSYGITRRIFLRDGSERLLLLPADAVMPELARHQLDDGSLPPGSLDGLTAVVGLPRDLDSPRFQPSGIANAPPLSAADFTARAIHAVRSGRTGTEISGVARLLLLVAAAFLMPAGIAAVPPRSQPIASVLIIGVFLAAGLLLVRFPGILVPFTELTLLATLSGRMAMAAARGERVRRLSLLAERAETHVARNSLVSDPRRWIDFFQAAARLTGVESSQILEANLEGEFDVKAAFGPQASLGAARLTPAADFNKANGEHPKPVQVHTPPDRPAAWLVRMNASDDAAIYWLFTVPAGDDRGETLIAAERLAEHAAQQTGLAAPSRRSRQRHPIDVRLYGALSAIISRTSELRHSFAAMQTATLLFDAAGVPRQINSAMERMLRAAGLQASRATPVDVASALSGIEPDSAREMLGELVRHGGAIRLNSNVQVGSRRFSVRAIATAGDLLFEATDVTHQSRLASIQTELATDIDARIRNDLAAIELATKLASDDRLPAERRERALAMIGQATKRTNATLTELGRLVDAAIYSSEGEGEPYPVNLRSALIQSVAATKTVRDSAGVGVYLQLPSLGSLVLAEPEMLEELLQAMLEILTSDSPRGTTLQAVLSEGDDGSELVVTGGFGLSAERWAGLLSVDDRRTPRPVRVLLLASRQVERWGGSLATLSDAGQGYRFTLRLKKS